MSQKAVVRLAVAYIEAHLFEEMEIEKIAEELNYSKFYIARAFREYTGGTIYKYIQGRRLTEAARMLVETDIPIIDIAYQIGYQSQQAFTQAFHQVYRYTPQVYRKNQLFYPKQTELIMHKRGSFLWNRTIWKGEIAS